MTNDDKKILADCLVNAQSLTDMVEYSANSIVSKTILDKPNGTITLFAFGKDQGLSEHVSPYDAVVINLDGSAKLTIDGKELPICPGQITVMPANVPHSVYAHEDFKMLLVLIR